MAVTKTIRIIREWQVDVPAEYGDTDEDLLAKVTEEQLVTPSSEHRVIVIDPDTIPPHDPADPTPAAPIEAPAPPDQGV